MPSTTHEPPGRLSDAQLSEDTGIEPATGPA